MSVANFDSPFALIVNLDSYAGNYERQFCAYVTGAVGDCGVGRDMAALFEDDVPDSTLCDRTDSVQDDNGCARPVSIYNDPADEKAYDSLVIFFATQPDKLDLALILERAQKFCDERPDWKSHHGEKTPLTLKSMKLISNKVVRTQEVISQVFTKSS